MPAFCDRCGAPVGAADQRCRTCGWPAPVPLTPAERGELVSRAGAPGTATDPAGTLDAGSVESSPRGRPVEPAGSGRTPGGGGVDPSAAVVDAPPTEAFGVTPSRAAAAAPRPPAAGGALDDPSGYGRWRLDDDPEPAQWREEPAPDEVPVRRSFGAVDDEGMTGTRIAVRVLAGFVATAVVVLVGLSVLVFGVLRPSGDRAPAGAAPRTTTRPVTTPKPGARVTSTPPRKAAAATPRPTTTTYPPVVLPGRACGGSGTGAWAKVASGSSQTSCPFAVAVQRAFLASSPKPDQPRTVAATSPVTGKAYPMTCNGNQPVTCRGGNGAVVYLYGGAATFG